MQQDNDATLEELVTQLQEKILCQGQPGHHGAGGAEAQPDSKKKLCMQRPRDTERVQQLRVQYWHEVGEVNLADERVCG